MDFFGQQGFVKNLACGDLWVWTGADISAEIAPLPPDQREPCE